MVNDNYYSLSIVQAEDQIDPSDVARSIQQLALSVQDTGMFGDLPKPRIDSRR